MTNIKIWGHSGPVRYWINTMKKTLSLSALMLMTTVPVFAQDAILLEEIVVSSGLTDTTIGATGAAVSVATEDDLASTTLAGDALNYLPGVSMTQDGGLGSVGSIRIRGLSQRYVGVMVDGMDVTDPAGTQVAYDFGGLSGMGFSQVEVIKGSQSAIHGSEAVAGVINLRTLSSNDIGERATAQAEMGSNNTRSAGIKYQNITETGKLGFVLNSVTTDGFSAKSTGTAANEKDPYSGTQMRIALEHNVSDNVTLTFNTLSSHEDFKYDGDFSPLTDYTIRNTNIAKLGVHVKTGAVTHSVEQTKGEFLREYSFGNYISNRNTLRYLANYELENGNVAVGAQTTKEEIDAVGTIGADKETAYFAEVNYALSNTFDVSAALRKTESDSFGNNTSYRVAAVYKVADDLTVRAMASTGFRAPSLYERFDPWSGDPTLKPEKSTSQEIGIEKSFGTDTIVSATAFQSEVENVIDYANWVYTQTDDKNKTNGIELAASTKVNDVISLGFGYTHTESKTGATKAARVPEDKYTLGVTAAINSKTTVVVNALHVTGYNDLVGGALTAMPDYTVVNASASYDLNDKLQAYVRVQNLADTKYETVTDFNTGGRQIFAGIRASF
jgi:vitamin B12 transporter